MRADELDYNDREILLSSGFDEDIPDRTLTEILVAIRAKKPIEATKIYHEVTGLGLRESKNAVDSVRYALAVKERDDCAKELGIDLDAEAKALKRKNKFVFSLQVVALVTAISYFGVKLYQYFL